MDQVLSSNATFPKSKTVKKMEQFIQIIFQKNKTFSIFEQKRANIHKLILQKELHKYVHVTKTKTNYMNTVNLFQTPRFSICS